MSVSVQHTVHIEQGIRSHREPAKKPIEQASCSHRLDVNKLSDQSVNIDDMYPTASRILYPPWGSGQKRKSLISQGLSSFSGRNRTRTCDPIDVNDVLYQLSHATMRDFYEVTSRYSPCGRIVKLIDVWEQVPEALQLRGFQAFRFDRQAIYSCLHTGVHRPLHTGVHDVCTRVCMAGCASHCP